MTEEITEDSIKEDTTSTQVLYEQLQSEYNKLLKQYAAAENTIDELRTGATVHLYTEPLDSRPNSRLSFETARYPQNINFPKPLQASTSEFSTMNETCSTNFSTGGPVKTPIEGENSGGKPSLQARIQSLKEVVNRLESVLSEGSANDEKKLNELLDICTQLGNEHGVLSRELTVLSRNSTNLSTSSGSNISTKTEMQKELQRIGLHIEEIQGDIMARLKSKKHIAPSISQPPTDKKPSLSQDLQSLVKEMKDLKDRSIKNSDEVLDSSRNMKNSSVLSSGRYSENDTLDLQYLNASPVNMDYRENSLSGSDRLENSEEQTLNMTWPPARHITDSDFGALRHSFSETAQTYGQSIPHDIKTGEEKISPFSLSANHSMSNSPGETPHNADQSKANHFSENKSRPVYYSTKDSPRQTKQQRTYFNSSERERKSSQNIPDRTECFEDGPVYHNSEGSREHSPFSSHETVQYKSNSGRSDTEKKEYHATREHFPSSDEETRHDKYKRSDHEKNHKIKNTQKYSPYSDEETPQHKHNQRQLPTDQVERTSKKHSRDLGNQTFHSMSSLADSSRMSTPLFQPRGAARVSPQSPRGHHAPRYKRRSASDGFDSGFVGSEASRSSRLTTDNPDWSQKLNRSSQWDSTLHLDLVSEMDENEPTSSPEQLSTSYEITAEDGRQSPTKSPRNEQDVKFINSDSNPLSSTERNARPPAGYFAYNTSQTRLPGNSNASLPVHNAGNPSSSRPSERSLGERNSSVEETSWIHRDSRRISKDGLGKHDDKREVVMDSDERLRSQDRTSKHNNDRKLQVLRDELDSLHDHVKKMQNPRVAMDMYDELRDQDEQLRRAHERRHERKLDELRQNVEQLKFDVKHRDNSEEHRRVPERDTEFYEEFRSELQKVREKLDELSVHQDTSRVHREILTAHMSSLKSPSTHPSPYHDDMTRRFSNLVRKVDELRLRIENRFDAPQEIPQNYCRLCDEVDHHGYETVETAGKYVPRTSTPFVSNHYHTGKQPSDNRSYLSPTYPQAIPLHPSVVHHIHTYHKGHELKDDGDEYDDREKRIRHRKRASQRSRYRSRHDSLNDHVTLEEAREAAWDVQRLSKNILNTISLDLTSLRS